MPMGKFAPDELINLSPPKDGKTMAASRQKQISKATLLFACLGLTISTGSTSLVAASNAGQVSLHDHYLLPPKGQSVLLESALHAASQGDRLKLAKIYRLSLLVGQKRYNDQFYDSLRDALKDSHEAAKSLYKSGNASEAVERLRLFFNLTAQLTESDYCQRTSEVEEWLAAMKIMTLPKDHCIAALNDYAFLLNWSGQYNLAIPVLKAVIKESPNRAVAYLNLADAQWASGEKVDAYTNYRNYKDLVAHRKTFEQAPAPSPELALGPCPDKQQLQRLACGETTKGVPERDLVVLCAKGKLLALGSSGTTKTPSPNWQVKSEPQVALSTPGSVNLPWLEDLSRDGNESYSSVALTDEITRSGSRHLGRHYFAPTANQKCHELNYQAVLALQDRQPEDAVKLLNEALEVDPGCYVTLGNLAAALNNLAIKNSDQPKMALKTLHQALALAPTNRTVQANTNGILLKMGKDPSSFKTRRDLGLELLQHGDYLGALIEYREALRLHQDAPVKDMVAALKEQIASDELLTPDEHLSFKEAIPKAINDVPGKGALDLKLVTR